MGGRFSIGASVLVGIALVAGAYFLRGNATADTNLEDPRAFVAALPLREYQETKDTDGDGLRDWLEELIGTNAKVNDALKEATTTATGTPFVADTETEKFAISFFEEVLSTHGGKDLTEEEKAAILQKSMREYRSLNTEVSYKRSDIIITEEQDAESVRSYGNAAGAVIVTYGSNPKNIESELVILGRALKEDDASLLSNLTVVREGYANIIRELLKVDVPEPLIDEHLLLLNSLQAVANDIAGFEKAFNDPLVAYLRTQRYESDVLGLVKALEDIRAQLEKNNIVYANDEAGNFFFSLRP